MLTGGDPLMNVERFFSRADHDAIETAVREGEAATSGEIVPVAVGRSADYPQTAWTAALLGALAAGLATAALIHAGAFWVAAPALWVTALTVVGAAAGFLMTSLLPVLQRTLLTSETLDAAVRARAYRAFVEHEAFATRERTGLVILLSLFERRVVILADTGINARVEQREWDEIATAIALGVRAGRAGEALADGIRRCGALLQRGGVERRVDDTDELADRLSIEER